MDKNQLGLVGWEKITTPIHNADDCSMLETEDTTLHLMDSQASQAVGVMYSDSLHEALQAGQMTKCVLTP